MPIASYNTGLTGAQFLAASQRGLPVETRALYNKARVVAGGFRLYKTSKADNESGTIKAHYAQRGAYINKSIKSLVDDPVSKTHLKVFIAGG